MSRDRSGHRPWSELRVGIIALVALATAMTVIFFTDEVRRALAEGPEIVVTAGRGRGLDVGAPVWVAGTIAGRVTAIHFARPDVAGTRRVRIRAVLYHGVADQLRADAQVRISPSALLAPMVLKIDPGSPGRARLSASDTLHVQPGPTPEELLARAADLRTALGSLAALQGELAGRIRDGSGTAARLIDDPAALTRLQASLAALLSLGRDSDGTIAKLLLEPRLLSSLDRSLGRLRDLAGRTPGPRPAGAEELTRALDRLASRLDDMEKHLASGGGTAGRLLYDRALQREIAELRAGLDSTRALFGRDALRWLRIRVF